MTCTLKPIRRSILKIPKGSFDKYSNWCQARKKWSLQLAIRFGTIKWSEISTESPPQYYDISHIGDIHKHQVVWWDETHPKCKIGAIQGRDSKVSYPRNEHGLIDIKDGTYEDHPTVMTLKYDKEIRIAFGVAVKDVNGVEVGTRCEPYFYTNKKIINIKTYEKLVKAQINYVKSIDYGDKNPWVQTIVVEGIFRNDDIKTIKNIGKEKKKVLNSMGIKTIQDLHEYDATLHNLTKKETAYLKQALDNSTVYQDEDRPIIKKNHLQHNNPYVSKYGSRWRTEIKKGTTLKDVVSVKELIDHIYKASFEIMKGTEYEENFFFYHDALTQLTDQGIGY